LIDAGRLVKREELAGDRIRLPKQPFSGEAPDIGAYESDANEYWIPGCRHDKASAPVPPHGSTTVKQDADLIWLQGKGAVAHHVYFKKGSPDAEWSPAIKNIQTNIFTPEALEAGEGYSWRVDAVLKDGSTIEGDVWEFSVK
jgi:hypothetical protein